MKKILFLLMCTLFLFGCQKEKNTPPEISGSPKGTATVGNLYQFNPLAKDWDGDLLSFSIINRPAWTRFDSESGILAGTPGVEHMGINQHIVIQVSDGKETAILFPFDITVEGNAENTLSGIINNAPIIEGTSETFITTDNKYHFSPQATDPEGDPLTFSIMNKPIWAKFNPKNGRLTGRPSKKDIGFSQVILISVSDGRFITTLSPFHLIIQKSKNSAPIISGMPQTIVSSGKTYQFSPSVRDREGDRLSFKISNKPYWANFNPKKGYLTGIPSAENIGTTQRIVISVSDGKETATLLPFNLTVLANQNNAPVINGTPQPYITSGTTYQFTPNASDPDGESLIFSIDNRPEWLSFNTTTGILSGTPSTSDIGLFHDIVLSVSDGRNQSTLSPFYIEVVSDGNGWEAASLKPFEPSSH